MRQLIPVWCVLDRIARKQYPVKCDIDDDCWQIYKTVFRTIESELPGMPSVAIITDIAADSALKFTVDSEMGYVAGSV